MPIEFFSHITTNDQLQMPIIPVAAGTSGRDWQLVSLDFIGARLQWKKQKEIHYPFLNNLWTFDMDDYLFALL